MKKNHPLIIGIILFLTLNWMCYGQNNRSIIGDWYNVSESDFSGSKMIGTAHIIFNADMTFSSYIHSVVVGGEMDGLEGTQELIRGKYSLTGNRLTLTMDAPLSGNITDTCLVVIENDILELSGFNNINNQFWFGSEYEIKWKKYRP